MEVGLPRAKGRVSQPEAQVITQTIGTPVGRLEGQPAANP
jgi:hypothetical protein